MSSVGVPATMISLYVPDVGRLSTTMMSNGAYVSFTDDRVGSIEVGKLADLVLLDRDLFAAGPGGIADARVLLTLSEGDVVHAADGWG